LQLEQLEHAHGLTGRRHHPQVAVRCDQHDPSRVDVEHRDATIGERDQQLHHIEVRHERVGQLHHRFGKQHFSRHRDLPALRPH
jgi:hypothetical protein